MTVFNTFFKVIKKYKGTVILYTAFLVVFGFMYTKINNDTNNFFSEELPSIAIVNDDTYEIYTTPDTFLKVKEAMETMGIKDFLTSEITYVASNQIEVADEETKEKIYNLIDALEDIDDVQDVYHNLSE